MFCTVLVVQNQSHVKSMKLKRRVDRKIEFETLKKNDLDEVCKKQTTHEGNMIYIKSQFDIVKESN